MTNRYSRRTNLLTPPTHAASSVSGMDSPRQSSGALDEYEKWLNTLVDCGEDSEGNPVFRTNREMVDEAYCHLMDQEQEAYWDQLGSTHRSEVTQ